MIHIVKYLMILYNEDICRARNYYYGQKINQLLDCYMSKLRGYVSEFNNPTARRGGWGTGPQKRPGEAKMTIVVH